MFENSESVRPKIVRKTHINLCHWACRRIHFKVWFFLNLFLRKYKAVDVLQKQHKFSKCNPLYPRESLHSESQRPILNISCRSHLQSFAVIPRYRNRSLIKMNKQCLSRKLLVGHLHKVAFYSPRPIFPPLGRKPCLGNNLRNAPNHLCTSLKEKQAHLYNSYYSHRKLHHKERDLNSEPTIAVWNLTAFCGWVAIVKRNRTP